MTLETFLQKHRLDDSLLMGFYGGGNYGDELLLEVLATLLKQQGAERVTIGYQHPERYLTFHHDFGYQLANMHDKRSLLAAIRRSKHIVVGGGGLWGLDANRNILLMSLMLFASRWLLRKKVYLLAVGYYGSAPRIGRVSAWLAGKAANAIIARDDETCDRFRRIQQHTYTDRDMAWHVSAMDLSAYEPDVEQLEQQLHVTDKTVFITLRHFKDTRRDHLAKVIAETLVQNTNKHIVIGLMEPRHVDPAGYRTLKRWQQTFPNVQIIDFHFNPLALYVFFQHHSQQLLYIGPQFHGLLSAHLTGVPYLPVAYDNKVRNLLAAIAPDQTPLSIQELQPHHLQTRIDAWYGGTA